MTRPDPTTFPLEVVAEVEEECCCPGKTCQPEHNEGRYCWRSGQSIPVDYFAAPAP